MFLRPPMQRSFSTTHRESRSNWNAEAERQAGTDPGTAGSPPVSLRLSARLYGSVVIAAHLAGSRRVPTLPRAKLDALRDSRIRQIVRYAARHVPYYRQLFRDLGVDPRGIRGARELDRLPILEKEFVRAHSELFLSAARPARNPLSFLSSGSTGRRLEIHHDRRSILANIAFGERERGAVNRLCGGSFRPKELYVSYPTSTFKAVIAFYEENTLRAVKPRRVFVPLSEPIEKIVEIANAEKPDILVGYGAWVDMFFKTVAARGLDVHLPKLVMYIGETLPPGGRAHIEQNFGVPVLSRYNAVESFKIGYFCEAVTGFHIHEDLCHVRIVGDDGADLGPGEQGALVLSNLINRGTVLLNYPIGDVAAWAEAPCSCGRTFRLMSELEGRVEECHPVAGWRVRPSSFRVADLQGRSRGVAVPGGPARTRALRSVPGHGGSCDIRPGPRPGLARTACSSWNRRGH